MKEKVEILFKNVQSAARRSKEIRKEARKQQSERLIEAVAKLNNKGISQFKIAEDMGVSWWTINNWIKKRRAPRFSTLKYFEIKYGVKII